MPGCCSEATRFAVRSSSRSLCGLTNRQETSCISSRFIVASVPQPESAQTARPFTVHLKMPDDEWRGSAVLACSVARSDRACAHIQKANRLVLIAKAYRSQFGHECVLNLDSLLYGYAWLRLSFNAWSHPDYWQYISKKKQEIVSTGWACVNLKARKHSSRSFGNSNPASRRFHLYCPMIHLGNKCAMVLTGFFR